MKREGVASNLADDAGDFGDRLARAALGEVKPEAYRSRRRSSTGRRIGKAVTLPAWRPHFETDIKIPHFEFSYDGAELVWSGEAIQRNTSIEEDLGINPSSGGDRDRGRRWAKGLSLSQVHDFIDQQVLGDFEWTDWGFESKPSGAFINAAFTEAQYREELEDNPRSPSLPKYTAKGWTGGDSRTLYAFVDKHTDRVSVRPGGTTHGIGSEATVRVATRAEAEKHWQSPLHSGWTVSDSSHREAPHGRPPGVPNRSRSR